MPPGVLIARRSADHFATVTRTLTTLEVPCVHDKSLVRGLYYYSRTVFEMQTKVLGGPSIPGIGFAIGFNRLVEIVCQIKAQVAP